MDDGFRMGTESCGWISVLVTVLTVAPLYQKCAILQTMKSQRNFRNELQCKTSQFRRKFLMTLLL